MTSYAKGRREEEALVRLLRSYGLEAERVPLSGAAHRRRADVLVEGLCLSVKYGAAAPSCLFRTSIFWLGPYLVVPLEPLLAGWIVPGGRLPSWTPSRQVENELAEADLLVARRKGGEWVVCGKPHLVLQLGGVMHLSKERIEAILADRGFQAAPGFAEKLLDLAFGMLEEAMERAHKEGRKELLLSDLPSPRAPKGKRKEKTPPPERKSLVLREEIRYRRPLMPVERKEG
ncbi:MAG: hypothetical protein QXK45_03870 [Thermofilaceae archaeon]